SPVDVVPKSGKYRSYPRRLPASAVVKVILPSPWLLLFQAQTAPAPEAGPLYSMAMAGSRWVQALHCFQPRGSSTSGEILSGAALIVTVRVTVNFDDSSMPPPSSSTSSAATTISRTLSAFIGSLPGIEVAALSARRTGQTIRTNPCREPHAHRR